MSHFPARHALLLPMTLLVLERAIIGSRSGAATAFTFSLQRRGHPKERLISRILPVMVMASAKGAGGGPWRLRQQVAHPCCSNPC
jgi:hypothetical protein